MLKLILLGLVPFFCLAAPSQTFATSYLELRKSVESELGSKKMAAASEEARFKRFLEILWRDELWNCPECVTLYGTEVPSLRRDDSWSDQSLKAIADQEQKADWIKESLAQFHPEKLSPSYQLNFQLFQYGNNVAIEGYRHKAYLIPLNQLEGIQRTIPTVLGRQSRSQVQDFRNQLARLGGVPLLIDQNIALMKKGIELGIVAARVPLRNLPTQIRNLIPESPLESPLLVAFRDRPKSDF